MNYWLVKQEPEDYAWADFVRDGRTAWTGVRNFQARNHLRAMASDDRVFYYHSGKDKMVAGLARAVRAAYPDPTADEGDWSAVDFVPLKSLAQPVTLRAIKGDKILRELALVRQSRLSVMPVTKQQAERLAELGGLRF